MHKIVGSQGYGKTMDGSGSNTGQTWEKPCTAWYPNNSCRGVISEVKSPKFLILSYCEADASCQTSRRTGERMAGNGLPEIALRIARPSKD